MTSQTRRQRSLSPSKRTLFREGIAIWQGEGSSIKTNMPSPLQISAPQQIPHRTAVPASHPQPEMAMQRVKSAFNLTSLMTSAKSNNQQKNDNLDAPRPPEPTPELIERLRKLDEVVANATVAIAKAKKDILTRRSSLYATVDPILIILKLLPQDLSNVHKCVRQALSWDFLVPESQTSFETDIHTISREICFALPHLAITERNESLDPEHGQKLTYTTTMEHLQHFQNIALTGTPEMMKTALKRMFPLEDNLGRALEGVEMCLRNLARTRIRYKRLFYEKMEYALVDDEKAKKSGVTMSVILHPSFN